MVLVAVTNLVATKALVRIPLPAQNDGKKKFTLQSDYQAGKERTLQKLMKHHTVMEKMEPIQESG